MIMPHAYSHFTIQIFQWFRVGFCLEKIIRFRPSALDDNETDLIICTGHSNEVLIYQNGEVSFDPIILNTHSLHYHDSEYRIFAHPIGPMLLPWAILMLMDKMNLCWGFWTKPLKSMNGISIKIKRIYILITSVLFNFQEIGLFASFYCGLKISISKCFFDGMNS